MIFLKYKHKKVIYEKTNTIKQVKISELIPYQNNARTHSDEQINKIRASLREFGFVNPVLIDSKNNIIAGHGRVEASKREGIEEVPCVLVEHLTETQKKAYILADNRLAEDAGWDMDLLKIEIKNLKEEDFQINLTGFGEEDFEVEIDSENIYTEKTDTPTYEKKSDEPPNIKELYDQNKTLELLDDIEKENLDEEIKLFLKLSAYRHIIFDFEKIAEFYCHSNKKIQKLMEDSALVIIDYNDAIKNGFTELKNLINEQYEQEYGERDE